jgi:tRNA-2-methylthio-N6-dimethylallyladenosine synthase
MSYENIKEELLNWSLKFKEKQGHAPHMCFLTFGCQMSFHDAELIAGLLWELGFVKIDQPEQADIIVMNTCSVRESAENRVLGQLGRLKHLKENNPDMIIAFGGCMAQRPEIVEKIEKSYRQVDLLFGTHKIDDFLRLLHNVLFSQSRSKDLEETNALPKEGLPRLRVQKHSAMVSITYGCNNFCTYCIVPYVRGRERSRRPEDIISEIEFLVADGVKEVTLLGQNVNSYGKGLEPQVDFADLLVEVAEITDLKRIRFMTSHPRDVSDKLISAFAQYDNICKHFHLPLQAGSNRILKAMNRGYSKEKYLQLAQKIKEDVPQVSFTTDIIVGFPSETEEEFQETLDLVEKIGFDSAYTFIYSKRGGTPAAQMEGQVPYQIKQQRIQRLMDLQAEISLQKNLKLEGETLQVLVEGPSKNDANMYTGRSDGYKLVHFPSQEDKTGEIISVKIEKASPWHLTGRLV